MKKIALSVIGILVIAVTLVGCGNNSSQTADKTQLTAKQRSTKIINRKETIWRETALVKSDVDGKGQLTALKTKKLAGAASSNLVWTTHNGQFSSGYTKTNYAKIKKMITKNATTSSDYKTKLFTIKQLNDTLKEAKASIRIHKYSDLVYLKSNKVAGGQSVGFIASDHKLYGLQLSYVYSATQANSPTDRAYILSDQGYQTPKKHVNISSLTGRWGNSDTTDQLIVRKHWIYQVSQTGVHSTYTRLKLQDLSKITTADLYSSATFNYAQIQALKVGYAMPRATTIAGSDKTYTYLVLNKKTLVRIGEGSFQRYTKLTADPTTTDLPEKVLQIFNELDGQGGTQIAETMTAMGNNSYTIGLVDNMDRLTKTSLQQNTTIKTATVSNGKITIKNE